MEKKKKFVVEDFNEVINEFSEEANEYPILTEEEEQGLLMIADMESEEGNKAIEKIVNSNMRNIIEVARRYEKCGLKASTLIRICIISLYRAADMHKRFRNCPYIVFAYGFMHWYIQKAIRSFQLELIDRIMSKPDLEE